MGKIIKAGLLSAIVSIIVFYLAADLLGNQFILKDFYHLSQNLWRNPNLLTKNSYRILKYLVAFFLTNTLWAYVYSLRQNQLSGSGFQKGVKFFFIFWLLTIPIHFWFWVTIRYPLQILIYNIFVTHLILFTSTGGVIGIICSGKK